MILLNILNDAAVCMISRPLISKSSSLCTKPLLTVLSAAITFGITITFTFNCFFSFIIILTTAVQEIILKMVSSIPIKHYSFSKRCIKFCVSSLRFRSLVSIEFASDPGDWGSIPGRVIKMVLDVCILYTQHYKVRMKDKEE